MFPSDSFKPFRHIPLSTLTHKVDFLDAITSARRVSELVALTCTETFLVLHDDKVVGSLLSSQGVFFLFTVSRTLFSYLYVLLQDILRRFPSIVCMGYALFWVYLSATDGLTLLFLIVSVEDSLLLHYRQVYKPSNQDYGLKDKDPPFPIKA